MTNSGAPHNLSIQRTAGLRPSAAQLQIRKVAMATLAAATLPEMHSMSHFLDLTEAQVAKGALRAEGGEPLLRDEYLGNLDWTCILALGGLRLEASNPELSPLIQDSTLKLVEDVPELSDYEAPDRMRLRLVKGLGISMWLVPFLALPLLPLLLLKRRK